MSLFAFGFMIFIGTVAGSNLSILAPKTTHAFLMEDEDAATLEEVIAALSIHANLSVSYLNLHFISWDSYGLNEDGNEWGIITIETEGDVPTSWHWIKGIGTMDLEDIG